MPGKNSTILAALCAYTPCQSPKESLASSHKQCKAQTISLTLSASKTPQNGKSKYSFPAARSPMSTVQPAAATEVPSHPSPQARCFTPSSISPLTADHGLHAEATKHHLGHSLRHFHVPGGTSSSHTPGSSPVWVCGSRRRRDTWGQVCGQRRRCRFHPSRPALPAWAPAGPRSPSMPVAHTQPGGNETAHSRVTSEPPKRQAAPHTHTHTPRGPGRPLTWMARPSGAAAGPPTSLQKSCGRPPPPPAASPQVAVAQMRAAVARLK